MPGAAPRRSGPRVHADPDRRGGRAAPPPVELGELVDVHVHAGLEQHVEVAFRQVRARVADLAGRPPALERVPDLARRARVDLDEPELSHEGEDLGLALRLQGEPEPERNAGSRERADQTPSLLPDPGQVVGERGRAVLTRDRLRIPSGDDQTTIASLEARPLPPRAHVGARC